MMVDNNISQYNDLKKLSILDYYAHIEVVNKNKAKMNKDGQSKNKV